MTEPSIAPSRRHAFTWADPAALAQSGLKLSGIDFLKAIQEGRLPPPPSLAALGVTIGEVESGRVTMLLLPREFHYNPIGTVHGGVLATLLDSVMGCAVHSQLPAGCLYTTLEIKVNYLRAVRVGTGAIRAEGKTIHLGTQTAVAEARILDRRDRPLATASTTCILLRKKADVADSRSQPSRNSTNGQ